MKQATYGFEYSWDDLKPVRPLAVTICVVQLVGGIIGLLVSPYSYWFHNLWIGGALATFPGYLIGLALLSQLRPGSVSENRVMINHVGLVSALLSALALAFPFWGSDGA
jgi:hypothetical protein